MKTKSVNLVLVFLLVNTFMVFGQEAKTEKFKVYGNCGMCESRIEKAANNVEGVTASDWSKETKMIEVTFDASKTDADKIQMAIAAVGHDTEMHKASEEVYNGLPGCCKYDRTAEEMEHDDMHHDHNH